MAISYTVLASGSGGNSVWVRGGGAQILVDCGLSARALSERLADVGGDIRDIQAVVCTHGHGDHVRGAAVLARRHGIAIHATRGTLDWIPGEPPPERLHVMTREGALAFGGLKVEAAPTLHDAPGSVALVLSDGETRLGVVTDLGVATQRLMATFEGLDGLVLESNHDSQLLVDGPYPAFLKRRIASEVGHLSNHQSGLFLERVLHRGLQRVTLAHLSEHNNTPECAREAAEAVLSRTGFTPVLAVAEQDRPGEPVTLSCGGQRALPF